MAETIPDREQRREWLTFAVAGAGPTGVELAGQIRELATHTISREFRSIDPAEARVLLFDGADAVLGSFGRSLSARAQKILDANNIETRLGVLVTDVDATGLVTTAKDGTRRVARRGRGGNAGRPARGRGDQAQGGESGGRTDGVPQPGAGQRRLQLGRLELPTLLA
jgi:hypothetical protein